ncbi:MAG: diadenylate cyclase CdaA [Candidatus Zixiibacteriota bacterium]|nr:MAG: diadenylate cyclase CdaA [candidate division Zixibacteria bacterium]
MSYFEYDLLTFGLKDLVDVLIVSFIIYQLLKLTKGTRSAQIIIGLFLIAGVAFLSFWFQLEGLTWLFSNLATVGFLVLVIVFQPELRGALAHIGQNRLLRFFVTLEQKKTCDEVTRAVLRLSELRYGGLVVIERRTGLRNYAETGKEMNAELSSELIVTLFTPYTPLHDGAVIVSGDYIVAAAASLPLSNNPRYRKLFGMRHKAAIGVSEVSDAVVVVVSEETAQVSIAHQGALQSNISKNEFKDILSGYLKK